MQIFTVILDTLFPPRPNEKLVRQISHIPYQPGHFNQTIYLSHFTDRLVSATITENKFQHNQTASRLLADLLSRWLSDQAVPVTLIPIPLSQKRKKQRGQNQVMTVLEQLPPDSVSIKDNLLQRPVDTVPQTSLTRAERLKNMTDAFTVSTSAELEELAYRRVIIIDDVITTGATLQAARATLAPHLPPSTTLLTLALAH